MPHKALLVIILVLFVAIVVIPKIEPYSSKHAIVKSYSTSPSSLPGWLYDHWHYYKPYWKNHGWRYWPRYGVFPFRRWRYSYW